MVSGRAYVNANPSQLIWMKSRNTIFVERDAAVLVDITSTRQWALNRQWLAFSNSFANPVKTDFGLSRSSHFCLPTHVWYFPGFPWLVFRFTGSSLSGKHKCAWGVKLLLTLLWFLKAAKRVVRIQNPSTNFAIDSQNHCWTDLYENR